MSDDYPLPPVRPERPQRKTPPLSIGTAIALLLVLIVGGGFLVFLTVITSSYIALGLVGVPLAIAGVSILHYCTWGYWLQRMQREEEPAQEFWKVASPPVSDVNPQIK